MINQLSKKNILRLNNLNSIEINYIIKLAAKLKKQKKQKKEKKKLIGKNIALIFENKSTRTRCSFEIAAYEQGANVSYLGPDNTQLKCKESIKDTIKILNKLYDGIQYRGNNHRTIEIIAQYSSIPVWNGLTKTFHPTQILADLLTIKEHYYEKTLCQAKIVYIGNARNNICNSLLEIAAITGIDLRIVAPYNYWPDNNIINECNKLIKKNKGKILITEDIIYGVKEADFIYTDVWVSMGEDEKTWKERIELLTYYQVNIKTLHMTNNPQVKILHCLPSFHNIETTISEKIAKKYGLLNGIEITNEVFESSHSIVFQQAENKLHTIKALMIATIL